MGTDIHWTTERRIAGEWQHDPEGPTFGGRSYRTFAVLAGVRNGSGFAGCDTGDEVVPIADPRGLPPDMSEGLRAAMQRAEDDIDDENGIWLGDHSFSFLSLAEILAYDWTQPVVERGWLSGPEYAEWCTYSKAHNLRPKSYCGGVEGPGIEHITEEEMATRLEAIKAPHRARGGGWGPAFHAEVESKLSRTYCLVQWSPPVARSCSEFWTEFMPAAIRYATVHECGLGDIRFVFGFDS